LALVLLFEVMVIEMLLLLLLLDDATRLFDPTGSLQLSVSVSMKSVRDWERERSIVNLCLLL